MSTRCSLDWNSDFNRENLPADHGTDAVPPFSVATDFHVPGYVFLEIEDCERLPLKFNTHPGMVEVGIPFALWNRLMKIGPLETECQST